MMPDSNPLLEEQLRQDLKEAAAGAPRFTPPTTAAAKYSSPSRGRYIPLLAAAATAAIVTTLATVDWPGNDPQDSPAAATSQSPDPDTQTSQSSPPTRRALDDALDRLDDWASTPGYSGLRVDDAGVSITVLWKGVPPAEVSKLNGQTTDGISISLQAVPYTLAELQEAGSALKDSAKEKGIHISGFGPSSDRNGLEIMVNPNRSKAAIGDSEAALALLQPLSSTTIVSVAFGAGIGTWPGPTI